MKKTKNTCRKGGHVMVAVMVAMFVLSILGMAKLTVARLDAVETIRLRERENAFFCAEWGMNEFVAIVTDSDNRASFQGLGLVGQSGESVVFDGEDVRNGGEVIGNYTLTLEPTTYWSDFFTQRNGYKVICTGRSSKNDRKVQITSYARTTTVAEQVWGSNSEGGIWFVTNDKIFGSIHSNDKFYIDGKPLFTNGVAKTHAAVINYKNGESSVIDPKVFTGGLIFNQPKIDFNEGIITEIQSAAAVTYPNNTKIVFKGNEYTVTSGGTTTTKSILDLGGSTDDDNIIYVNGNVTVSGHVGQPVSVVAKNSILIDASGPEKGVVCSDKRGDPNPRNWSTLPPEEQRLGLFATQKVMVTGTSNGVPINLHAALYIATGETSDAVNDRGFCVQKYDQSYGSPPINFYGSMVQKLRGAVGQSGGKGFSKNYNQDLRFLRKPPPATPITAPEFSGWEVAYL